MLCAMARPNLTFSGVTVLLVGGFMFAVHSSVSASALDSPSDLEVVCVKLS